MKLTTTTTCCRRSLSLVVVLFQTWTLFVHAVIYPGPSDSSVAGSGAPQGLSSGWTPPAPPRAPDMSQRPPPVQGFPPVSPSQISAMATNFNRRHVPAAPTKPTPDNFYQLLQTLRMHFKRMFPQGLPPILEQTLNPSPGFGFNNNNNNNNNKPSPSPSKHGYHHQMPGSIGKQQQQQQQQQGQPSFPPMNRGNPPPTYNNNNNNNYMGWSSPPRQSSARQPYAPQSPNQGRYPPQQQQGGGGGLLSLPAHMRRPNMNFRAGFGAHYMGGGNECSGAFLPGQLCCDGIRNMIPRGGQGHFMCCSKGIYNASSHRCCGDMPVPKPSKPMSCCGTMLFDPRTHVCCDKMPYPNQGGTIHCCRKQPYNPRNEMCCGESVKPRTAQNRGMNCCGKHMFNPSTHMCCDEGNTFPKTPGLQCCGKNQYRPAIQQCCFGDAFPKGIPCFNK